MKKKLFVLISAIAMTFTIITSNIFATEVELQPITQVGDYSTNVTIDGGVSTFSVTIPKSMGGNGESGTLDYDVRIVGDIAGNEILSVIPDSTLTLSQTGKKDIIATISQLKTKFTGEDFALSTIQTTTGSITYEGLSSGTWKGVFNFYISLKEKSL